MQIDYSSNFKKRFRKIPEKIRARLVERLQYFVKDQFDPRLNNHMLHGKYAGCHSINVTGDIRAIYEIQDGAVAYFIDIGSHAELYK